MDYLTLLQKYAKEKENTPYLILRDRQIAYGQAYEDVRGFIMPEWRKQFPTNYKTGVLIRTQNLYYQLLAFLAVMGAGQVPVIGHYDLPEAAEEKLVAQNRIGFVLEEKENGWILRQGWQGYSATESDIGAEAGIGTETTVATDAATGTKETAGTEAAAGVETGEAVSRPEMKQKATERFPGFVPAPVPYQNACMGVLSSGSTDVPKVMYRTYESWAGFIPEQNRRFCIGDDAVVFTEGSFSFTGNLSVWASVVYAGCTLAVSEVFNCRQWLEMIEKHRVSVLYLVPAKLKMLTRYLQKEYSSVKMILAGSQLLGAKVAEKLKNHFLESEIILYYGASELDYITWLSYEEMLRFPDSVGKPAPGVTVWVENGLIYIDTPYHVEGLRQPCTLHDTGYFNEEGYLIFNGREHDIINKGGFKISCTKIENALCSLSEVAQAVVLPYEDAGRGQEAAAFVVCEREITRQELRQHVKRLLMQQEMPKKIIFLKEIPMNSRGKTDKKALQTLLE